MGTQVLEGKEGRVWICVGGESMDMCWRGEYGYVLEGRVWICVGGEGGGEYGYVFKNVKMRNYE